MKRFCLWRVAALLALTLFLSHAEGQFVVEDAATPTPAPPYVGLTPPPFEQYPVLSGLFLPQGQAPFVHIDEKAGRWIYIDQQLHVDITRFAEKVRRRPTVWYISHIYFDEGLAFRSFLANEEKSGRGNDKPENIASRHRVIYAQNGDLFTYRVREKRYPGIIIRGGRIIHSKTYSKAVTGVAPLDELSLYPDGRMEVHYPGQITAQEYVQRGATDVFAFGPILIQNGIIDERLKNAWHSYEPRSAIGLAAPGHAVGILVEGRNKRSDGQPLDFVAGRLLEHGCMMAYNLDGGQTAAMMFMGKNVMTPGTYNNYHKTRSQPDIIGIGTYNDQP